MCEACKVQLVALLPVQIICDTEQLFSDAQSFLVLFGLQTSLTEARKIILFFHFPIFCPCVIDPSKRPEKDLVAPLTMNKHSLLSKNLASEGTAVLWVWFLFIKK